MSLVSHTLIDKDRWSVTMFIFSVGNIRKGRETNMYIEHNQLTLMKTIIRDKPGQSH